MAPQVRTTPRGPDHREVKTVANVESSAHAQPSTTEKRLAELEERLAHENLSVEERCELEDQVRCLRRRLEREER